MTYFNEYELKTRAKIKKLIEDREYDEARAMSSKFLKHKTRRVRRLQLMHTIRAWVSVMNKDHNTIQERK